MLMGQWLMESFLMRVLAMVALLASAPSASGVPSPDAGTGVDLGGVFGEAKASATELTAATMELDLEVEAHAESVVVAHLIEPGGAQDTVPLVSRSAGSTNLGRFGIRTEVRKIDYVVVFEVVGEIAAQSQPVRLTDLGVEPALLGVLPVSPTDPDEVNPATRLWGWAGLGLAATALAVLAFWAMPDRRKREKEDESPQSSVADRQTHQDNSLSEDEIQQSEHDQRAAKGEEKSPNSPD